MRLSDIQLSIITMRLSDIQVPIVILRFSDMHAGTYYYDASLRYIVTHYYYCASLRYTGTDYYYYASVRHGCIVPMDWSGACIECPAQRER